MSDKLWSAGEAEAGPAEDPALDAAIATFCAADDAALDNELLEDDLICSRAHVRGLHKSGILDDDEVAALTGALDALVAETKARSFRVGQNDEDGHSAIERALTERLGDTGRKVHTGRSRNDQVLVASRRHLKRSLLALAEQARAAARVALDRAEQEQDTLLPGYTHLQRAVPSSWGFFFAGHAESLAEDALALDQAATLVDASPLGTAAGYGVNLALERDFTAGELGFGRVLVNGLCAQNGRGRLEAHALSAVLMLMGSIRRLAWDLSLFTTGEVGFVRLPARWCTGSSIMPNKRNPDVVELLRASFATVAGAQAELFSATSLPSGYQRDLQVTKAPVLRALTVAGRAAGLLPALLAELEIDEEACLEALEPAMLATDKAVEQAAAGVPFRDAYREVKKSLAALDDTDVVAAARESIRARVSPGGPGQLWLERIRAFVDGQAG